MNDPVGSILTFAICGWMAIFYAKWLISWLIYLTGISHVGWPAAIGIAIGATAAGAFLTWLTIIIAWLVLGCLVGGIYHFVRGRHERGGEEGATNTLPRPEVSVTESEKEV